MTDAPARQLGLQQFSPSEEDIKLSDVYTPDAPTSEAGVTGLDWGVLGNTRFGDCYWACEAHLVMAMANLAGRKPSFSEESVLESYAEYLGLPSASSLNRYTDHGTDARDGAKFARATGVRDATGRPHRIGAFLVLEEADYGLILSAVRDFGGVNVCVNLPRSAEEAFNGPGQKVWDYVPGSPILGGHSVAGVAVRDGKLVCVSWGEEVEVTEAFLKEYLQCVVVYVSSSALDSSGETVNGLDKRALLDKLAALR